MGVCIYMIRHKARWAVAACMICAVQPWTVSAAIPVTAGDATVYQTDLDRAQESYPGELTDNYEARYSTIRVVKRGNNETSSLKDKNAKAEPADRVPTRVDADKMKYTSSTGDVYAEGNVILRKDNQELQAPRVEGNTNTTEYKTSGGSYRYKVDGGRSKDLTGKQLTYRSSDSYMTADSADGWSDPYYITGTDVVYDGEVGHIKKGSMTTKNAKAFVHTSDYRIEGQDIVVYPGDKAVIKHASFFIKNFRLFSLKSYTVSLRHDKEGQFNIFSLLPRPMYNSDDGFGFRGNTAYPVGPKGEIALDYEWYSQEGFKPSLGYRHSVPWGNMSLGYKNEKDTYNDETVWIEKTLEFRADTHAYHVGHTPFTVRGGVNAGYWKEDEVRDVRGMHYQYYGELSHDAIRPWKNATLRFFMGYERDYYKYNDTVRSMPYWGVTFRNKITNRLTTFASYNQRNIDRNNSPYFFDTIETPKEFRYGLSYKVSRIDDFTVSVKVNVETGESEDINYTWHRDLHSFDSFLTYKSKSSGSKWEFKIIARDFS